MALRASEGKRIVMERPALRPLDFFVGLPVPQIYQEQTQWCWAACAIMVARYYGDMNNQQCDLASWLFSQPNCCSDPSSSLCNGPCRWEYICDVYESPLAFARCVAYAGYIPPASIKYEIDRGRPIECGFVLSDASVGHSVIVSGYYNDVDDSVYVNDPADGEGAITWTDLLNAYFAGSWNYTWTDLKR